MKICRKNFLDYYHKDMVFLHYTGSMFGIGCSVFSFKGIEKILNLKKRDSSKGLIVLLADISNLKILR